MSRRVLQENKARQIFGKTNISYPLIRSLIKFHVLYQVQLSNQVFIDKCNNDSAATLASVRATIFGTVVKLKNHQLVSFVFFFTFSVCYKIEFCINTTNCFIFSIQKHAIFKMILVWLTSVFVFLRPVDSVKEKEVTKQCLVSCSQVVFPS